MEVKKIILFFNALVMLFCLGLLCLTSCNLSNTNSDAVIYDTEYQHLIDDVAPINSDGLINVVIEIPAGTNEKWEVCKITGELDIESINGNPRTVNYLSYPGNYGMIPQTLLSYENGGDGDPIDVLVLGSAIDKGKIVPCKIIGVIKLFDGGEQDDKLIAVYPGSNFYHINDISELEKSYSGVLEILEIWFTNYKGQGQMEFNGFGDKTEAELILQSAIKSYQN